MLIFIIGFTVTCILPGIVPDQSLPALVPTPIAEIPEIQPSVKPSIIPIILNIFSIIYDHGALLLYIVGLLVLKIL
jgi:hypothetical protein